MLDFVYTLLIAPLEYWMHAALVWGHGLTLNWGWAIVVMSLIVNTVILPIYIKAERWQESERALRKSFEPTERMIRRTFKGQERFAMLTTLHRQAGNSPLLALRSSIGFFLQIPFFFAAYHFLSHFEPLAGVSFLGLSDLSKPDAAISLAGFSVNVMPLLMTAINLASALIYTHNLTRRDKLQLYGMAAVFLVLLYDAASGLVLYWTCNNIYSLAKNIVWQELGRARPLLQRVLERIRALRARRAPEPFPCRAGIAAALVSSLRLRLWRRHPILLLLSIVIAWYGLRVWGKWFFFGEHRRAFAVTGGFLFLIPALGVLNAGWGLGRFLFPKVHSLRSSKPAGTLLVPAGLWLTVLLAAYLPVQAYCTAAEIFSPTAVVLAKSLMWTALLGAGIWIFGFLAEASGAKNFAGWLLGAVAAVLTVYAFVLPLDVGTIDAFQIARPEALFGDVNLLVDLVVVAGTLALFAVVIRKGGARWIKTVFVICLLGALVNGTLLLWDSRGQWKSMEQARSGAAAQDVQLPAYTERLFSLSPSGQNIVVVMLDSFTGTHVEEILKAAPELREQLEGFVWYPDNVSAGGSTNTGVASILCGAACSPQALNAATRLWPKRSTSATQTLSIGSATTGTSRSMSATGLSRCAWSATPRATCSRSAT